jgi:hypothetical protein
MTYDDAMAAIRGPGTKHVRVFRPGLPGPVALRFGYPAILTSVHTHIAYTPTAEDMAADDWRIGPGSQ